MRRLSQASRRLYGALTGEGNTPADPEARATPEVLSAGPTLVRIEGPEAAIEDSVAVLDDLSAGGRQRNTWLARNDRQALAMSDEGVVLHGRKCCLRMAMRIDRELHRLALPARRVCPECGTTWQVEMRPREERRHAWTR